MQSTVRDARQGKVWAVSVYQVQLAI